jgi:hypothetical protein
MSKVIVTMLSGVGAVYPFGQQREHLSLKEGQTTQIELINLPAPKENLPERMAEDLTAPAIGVNTDEPFGNRDGVAEVKVIEGAVVVRVYEGAEFTEFDLKAKDGNEPTIEAAIIESNRVTMAIYPGHPEKPQPK